MEPDEIELAINRLKDAITNNRTDDQEINDIEKVAFQKPNKWPRNTRELRLDQIDKAIGDFQKDPNYASRERLVSLSFDYDANQIGSIGDMSGVSPYEISLVQNIYKAGSFHNILSLRILALRVIAEWVLMDRMVLRFEGFLKSRGARVPCRASDWFRYLGLNFQLLYTAIDNYQDTKSTRMSDILIALASDLMKMHNTEHAYGRIAHDFILLIYDLSCTLGSKHDQMFEFTREEIERLTEFEANLLKKVKCTPFDGCLKGVLMIQISNFILKSRDGYAKGFSCKYISESNARSAIGNGEIWVKKIPLLNDEREGCVVEELMKDDSWIEQDWARQLNTKPTRVYYVNSFSKSPNNERASKEYGACIYGFKGDRLLDLLGPMYIDSSLVPCDYDGNPIPKGKPCTICSQTVAFDVLYDRAKAKEELQLLIKIIDKFQMTEKQKKDFLEEILQYWMYSVKDSLSQWEDELERRYVVFTYNNVDYLETCDDDTYHKMKTSIFRCPDFVLGPIPHKKVIQDEITNLRHFVSVREYMFCNDCLNRDYDAAHLQVKTCPICGSANIQLVEPDYFSRLKSP